MSPVTEQIIHVISRKPDGWLEALVRECPRLTWIRSFVHSIA